jgi:hypothetical protein
MSVDMGARTKTRIGVIDIMYRTLPDSIDGKGGRVIG